MNKWTSVFVEQRGDHRIYREELGDSYYYRITYRHKYVGVAFTMPEVNRVIAASNNTLDIEAELLNAVGMNAHQVEEAVA